MIATPLSMLTDAQLDELAGLLEAERRRRRPPAQELDGWRLVRWQPRPGGGLVDFALGRELELEEFEAVDLGARDRSWALSWGVEQIAERRRFGAQEEAE